MLALIQARINSTRLPGKVLLPLGDKRVLEHIVDRAWKIKDVSEVGITIPFDAGQSELNDYIYHRMTFESRYHVKVSYGPENDLRERTLRAMRGHGDVLRIWGDCPLIDPATCSSLVAAYKQDDTHFGLAVIPEDSGFPRGWEVHVASLKVIYNSGVGADGGILYPDIPRLELRRFQPVDENYLLDTPEDYQRLCGLFS